MEMEEERILFRQLIEDGLTSTKLGSWVMGEVREGHDIWEVKYHGRGGERVGIKRPDGSYLVLNANDIAWEYNSSGIPVRRWVANDPPEGYSVLPGEELQDMLQRILYFNWPSERGKVNIFSLGPFTDP